MVYRLHNGPCCRKCTFFREDPGLSGAGPCNYQMTVPKFPNLAKLPVS